ncbi:O-antigen ligase-related protein [Candidatus Omnitrophus magneticus]|uniref:O-antigen ligase-related protein n=1 Tax=Candidatus Omnitrophus magneticus TaxID=1609969 RepID=A0A0F0CV42_9BACT|nr:O-antigen ligase-related protein [Candidatus Omnitrophus magneticus]
MRYTAQLSIPNKLKQRKIGFINQNNIKSRIKKNKDDMNYKDFFSALKATFNIYKKDLLVLLFAILMFKFGRRWQDGIMSAIFFPAIFVVMFKMSLEHKLYTLIFLIPWAESRQMPGQMMGIVGFNPVNILFLMIGTTIMYRKKKIYAHSVFNKWILFYMTLVLIADIRGVDTIPYFDGYFTFTSYFLDVFLKPLEIVLAGTMAFYVLKDPEEMTRFLRMIKISGALLAVYVVFRGGGTLGGVYKLTRTLSIHKNALSFIFLTLLTMNLATMNYGEKGERIINKIFNVLYILGIMLTFSRQGYISCVLILFLHFTKKGTKGVIVFIVSAILFWSYFMPVEVKRRIFTGTAKGEEMGVSEHLTGDVTAGREAAWEASMPVIKEAFWFGRGMYTFAKEVKYGRPELPQHPHNAYIQSMLDNGLIGTILFLTFFISLFYKSWRLYKTSKSVFAANYGYGFAITILIFLIQGVTGFRFYPYEESYFIWFYLGGLMWVYQNQTYLSEQES